MNSRIRAHAFHLTTNSFAEHKALQAYAEAYMGKYGRFRKLIIGRKTIAKNPKLYFRTLLRNIQSMRLPRDTYLKNIQDEITARPFTC